MKTKTEPTQEAVIRQLVSVQKKARGLIDQAFELENKAARMRGEKPPHPSKAKRKATGYGQPPATAAEQAAQP
jgi:hypothetical protein